LCFEARATAGLRLGELSLIAEAVAKLRSTLAFALP
jgi:hypothetical protein